MSSSSKTSGSTATQNAPTTKPQSAQSGQSQSGQPAQSGQSGLPHDKIAMRAYTKWQQRGCPCGTDMQDWQDAETELKAELARGNNSASAAPAKPAQQRR